MRVGFIGLGIMGKPMCKNIISHGYEVTVLNRHQDVTDELVKMGAHSANTPAEVAKVSDVVITMVPNSPQVREVALSEGGIIEGATEGLIVVDMSSIDPMESKSIGAELAKAGIRMVDAPVSGGEPKAIDGTLSVMAGGSEEDFEAVKELLGTMAASVVRVGNLGDGNVAKLANQMIVAANIAALSEAMTFAKKAGADQELVYKAIRGGLAGSTVMDAKAPMMMAHDFKPGFRVELHIKDLNNAVAAAHSVQSPIPLTAQTMEMMQVLKGAGFEKEDHSALYRYYEMLCK